MRFPVRFSQYIKASILISFRLSGKCRLPYSPEHLTKACSPINSNDSGRISSPTNLQLLKVPLDQLDSNPLPIFFSVDGRESEPLNAQSPNAAVLTSVTPSGIIREPVRFLQFSNAQLFIIFKVSGNTSLFKLFFPAMAPSGISSSSYVLGCKLPEP